MNVTIVPISSESRALLACAPGWQETAVPNGKRVASHYHDFQAYYFTFGISKLMTTDGEQDLPEAAMIVVPEGVAHSWVGSEGDNTAVVGHFHDGHGYHFLENHVGGLAV
jgi:quercetin dioxygenase-like cupin family protein